MSQETTPNPVQQLQEHIQSTQYKLNNLQSGVRLASVCDEVEDIDTKINSFPDRLLEVRTKGYMYEKALEGRAEAFKPYWTSQKPSIVTRINQQASQLEFEVRKLDPIMMQLTSRSKNPGAAAPFLSQLDSAIDTMESKVSSSQSSVRGMYDSFKNEVEEFENALKAISDMLDLFAAASFQLHATEAAVKAVKAVWAPNGKEDKDDPEGVVFLTDQRILFEQNEEVATKKFLFITTESEKVQKLLFEFPVVLVTDVEPSKLGLFKNEDHIDIQLAQGGPFPKVHLHLNGQDCNDWDKAISRAKAKEFDSDRIVPVAQEAIEKVKKAPAQCPTCGGTINKPVLRGQDTITCDYCGFVIRL